MLQLEVICTDCRIRYPFSSTFQDSLSLSLPQSFTEMYGASSHHCSNFKIHFIVPAPHGGAGKMRGILITELMNDTTKATWSQSITSPTDVLGTHVCVFVKRFFESQCKVCESVNAICCYDFLDRPLNWSSDALPQCLIAGSPSQARSLRNFHPRLTNRSFVVIPHLHSNFEPAVQEPLRVVPRIIGSLSSQIRSTKLDQSLIMKLRNYVSSFNVSFVEYASTKVNKSPLALIMDVNGQRIHHELTRGVDIAIIWPANNLSSLDVYHLFRPLTRAVYWMSHGVPFVCSASPPYAELLKSIGVDTYLVAKDEVELFEKLRVLIENAPLRAKIRKIFLSASKLFSAEVQTPLYQTRLCEVYRRLVQ